MLEYLNELPNEYRDNINIGMLKKEYDPPLIEFMVDAFKGLEILPNIKILGYQWEPQEEKYDINDHVIRRNINKNKVIKNIAETCCGVLYIDIEVSGLDKSGVKKVHYIKKPIIIPIQDEDGYYLIKGKKCYLIYQMVDKMMYPSFGAVTIKSLMPICVKTSKEEFTEILSLDSNETKLHTIPVYSIQIFKSPINVLLIYSHLGIHKTLNFLEVGRFVDIIPRNEITKLDPDNIYISCAKRTDVLVVAKRNIFEKEIFVRSIVGCLVKLLDETKVPYEKIDDWETWMCIVGGKNTVGRGIYQHIFFNRLLDDVTRKELKINDYDKQNIYYLLRWILNNFFDLWKKDNLSMINKRLRCAEYLSTLITAEISKRINRLVSLGDKATIREYLNIFKFPPDIFVSKLYSSGVLRYAETVNDLDSYAKLMYTKKGRAALPFLS